MVTLLTSATFKDIKQLRELFQDAEAFFLTDCDAMHILLATKTDKGYSYIYLWLLEVQEDNM